MADLSHHLNLREPFGATGQLAAAEAGDPATVQSLLARDAGPTLGGKISAKLGVYEPKGIKARVLHRLANLLSRRVPGMATCQAQSSRWPRPSSRPRWRGFWRRMGSCS
ncbi:MAG: hypothetical protein AAFW64_11165 [Pseudomonadota bacterium]